MGIGKMVNVMEKVIYMHSYLGVCIYSDGTEYRGDWKDGKKHGKGNFY